MKKASRKSGAKKAAKRAPAKAVRRTSDGMRTEYDFRGARRGKYAARFQRGSNVVVLAPDVAAAFKDGAAVNHALRTLMDLVPPQKSSRRTA